jgi:hypothetical protein
MRSLRSPTVDRRMDRGMTGGTRHGGRRIRPVLWREARGEGAQHEALGQVHPSRPLARGHVTRDAGAGASIPLRNSGRPEGIIVVKDMYHSDPHLP